MTFLSPRMMTMMTEQGAAEGQKGEKPVELSNGDSQLLLLPSQQKGLGTALSFLRSVKPPAWLMTAQVPKLGELPGKVPSTEHWKTSDPVMNKHQLCVPE